ncbi:MAG TPA: methylmalonyl-CoA mutase family protein [Gemmatimonadales bacterium]|nr:methylmalonyl-CoA mutase family protein [Gemmatimonadales bacterium]
MSERRPVYGPAEWPGDTSHELGRPGAFPFTRGVHPTMYRGRLWTMRQYAGFGTAEETNARFRHLLEAGQSGLSVAFDLPTQMGYDSDHPAAAGEVGRAGVAIDTVDDFERLFHGIPLDQVSTSMTINATAAILLAMYVVVGEEQGVDRTALRGTLQNDILKEFIARGTYIYPPEPSLRLVVDVFRFVSDAKMKFNPISISGYHIREAGATAVQEVAFTFADGLEYVRRAVAAGLDVNRFAPLVSFFFAGYTNFFEEIAKFRAARRLWARLMRERFQADDEAARLRFHTQTGGATLTAQQPMNNVVRVAMQALAAVLGGTQSLHTNSYDEALALPTQLSATLALRTQQVLAHETAVPQVVDPLGGSWFLESKTAEIEQAARALLDEVEKLGGAARAIEQHYFQDAIAKSAYDQQRRIEQGTDVVVGVNEFVDDAPAPAVAAPDYSELAKAQRRRLAAARAQRNGADVQRTLTALREAARSAQALVLPSIVDAVRARATVGEISDVFRDLWGVYRPV